MLTTSQEVVMSGNRIYRTDHPSFGQFRDFVSRFKLDIVYLIDFAWSFYLSPCTETINCDKRSANLQKAFYLLHVVKKMMLKCKWSIDRTSKPSQGITSFLTKECCACVLAAYVLKVILSVHTNTYSASHCPQIFYIWVAAWDFEQCGMCT